MSFDLEPGFVEDAQFERDEPMPRQRSSWTCSAASLAWLNRAMGIDRAQDEDEAVALIGRPDHINPEYGLLDGSGARLAELLREDRGMAWTAWLDYAECRAMSYDHAMLIGGARWYHWVGVRGERNDKLWIANSAGGWRGVFDVLSSAQWRELGPFSAVIVPIHWEFPELPEP
jgi:hypothetical protein